MVSKLGDVDIGKLTFRKIVEKTFGEANADEIIKTLNKGIKAGKTGGALIKDFLQKLSNIVPETDQPDFPLMAVAPVAYFAVYPSIIPQSIEPIGPRT